VYVCVYFHNKWRLYSDTWVHTCTSTFIVDQKSQYPLFWARAICRGTHKLLVVIRVPNYASKICFQHSIFLWCHLFVSLGFSFIDIDPNKLHVEWIIIELNGTTNYSISCRTTDVNDITTLLYNDQEVTVGGRVTLDKQVFTIHGILLTDTGSYTCKARNGVGTVIKRVVLIYVKTGKPIHIWIQHQPVWGWVWVGQWP